MNNKISKILICFLIIICCALLYVLLKDDTLFLGDNNTEDVHTVYLKRNGASSIEKTSISCSYTTTNNKCFVTLPKIEKKDGVVLGWSNGNKESIDYKIGDTIELSTDLVLYAVTYKELNLKIDSKDIDYLEENNISCKVFNDNDSCSVKIPNFNKKGYENRGYSINSSGMIGTIFPNTIYELKRDLTLYPIYGTNNRKIKINTKKVINKLNYIIEVEEGCNDINVNEFNSYLEKINTKAPYLLIGSKITYLSVDTFNKVFGSNYAGMNYGPSNLRSFDIKCGLEKSSHNYYLTMVHELAHTWDMYYANFNKRNITEESDWLNLYIKYSNLQNRPFRDYSYTIIEEFFADAVKYYYFKYLDPIDAYTFLNYPDDIKKTIEKYMCITKNDYINNNCDV